MLQTKPRLGPQKWRANHYSGFFIAAGVGGSPVGWRRLTAVIVPKVILSLRNKR